MARPAWQTAAPPWGLSCRACFCPQALRDMCPLLGQTLRTGSLQAKTCGASTESASRLIWWEGASRKQDTWQGAGRRSAGSKLRPLAWIRSGLRLTWWHLRHGFAGRAGWRGRGQTNKIRRGASHLSTFQPRIKGKSTGEVGGATKGLFGS